MYLNDIIHHVENSEKKIIRIIKTPSNLLEMFTLVVKKWKFKIQNMIELEGSIGIQPTFSKFDS